MNFLKKWTNKSCCSLILIDERKSFPLAYMRMTGVLLIFSACVRYIAPNLKYLVNKWKHCKNKKKKKKRKQSKKTLKTLRKFFGKICFIWFVCSLTYLTCITSDILIVTSNFNSPAFANAACYCYSLLVIQALPAVVLLLMQFIIQYEWLSYDAWQY